MHDGVRKPPKVHQFPDQHHKDQSQINHQHLDEPVVQEVSHLTPLPAAEQRHKDDGHTRLMAIQLQQIQATLEQHSAILNKILASTYTQHAASLTADMPRLPLESIELINTFEVHISEEKNYNAMVNLINTGIPEI